MGVLTAPGADDATGVADRIRRRLPELPPAERRVARVLVDGYPVVGLEPLAAVAGRAGTSAPTVLRFVGRLGYAGYPQFQRALRDELAARFSSPADVLPHEPATDLVDTVREAVCSAVTTDLRRMAAEPDLASAARLLADRRRTVWTVGGRFSAVLADYLAAHLQILRPGVHRVPGDPGGRHAAALDVDRRSVVVAFDYRRYQHDTIEFGTLAVARGAALVLFTDRLLSPLAHRTDLVVVTTIDTGSPFAVLSPAMAAVETLLVTVVDRLGAAPRERLQRYDALSTEVEPPPGWAAGLGSDPVAEGGLR